MARSLVRLPPPPPRTHATRSRVLWFASDLCFDRRFVKGRMSGIGGSNAPPPPPPALCLRFWPSGHPRAQEPPLERVRPPPARDVLVDAHGRGRGPSPSSVWTRRGGVQRGRDGGYGWEREYLRSTGIGWGEASGPLCLPRRRVHGTDERQWREANRLPQRQTAIPSSDVQPPPPPPALPPAPAQTFFLIAEVDLESSLQMYQAQPLLRLLCFLSNIH